MRAPRAPAAQTGDDRIGYNYRMTDIQAAVGRKQLERLPGDWPVDGTTGYDALAEFERRHRVYGWGFLGRETLEMLRRTPMEGDQEAVIRVLTERAMHAAESLVADCHSGFAALLRRGEHHHGRRNGPA